MSAAGGARRARARSARASRPSPARAAATASGRVERDESSARAGRADAGGARVEPHPGERAPLCPEVRAELRLATFALECGAVLEDVRQHYRVWGAPNAARDDVVVVLHALTGSADVAGADTGWWRDVVGPGRAVDTTRRAVIAPNLLGSCYGTTGPATPWRTVPGTWDAARGFPPVTPRDMARFVLALLDALHVRGVAAVLGGSLGGMVAQELLLERPGLSRGAVVLAAPAAHTAAAIGWNRVQREALALGARGGDPDGGVALAREIAMLTFRTEAGLEARFGRATGRDAPYAVEDWLAHHGRRLVARFDAATYRTLLDAMDAHDVARGRGSRAEALAALGAATARLIAVGVPGDVLYSADVVRAWAREAGAEYRALDSAHGHDAFLLEGAQVAAIVREALEGASAA